MRGTTALSCDRFQPPCDRLGEAARLVHEGHHDHRLDAGAEDEVVRVIEDMLSPGQVSELQVVGEAFHRPRETSLLGCQPVGLCQNCPGCP